ncbi:MAG: DNA repair protein RecO [Phycisphaeraceae bacterium]|jgi:DNA repair protein RecO (recombination protein O)|nr:DNA repair protein RecO [Phycisphaeraceae bacterium]
MSRFKDQAVCIRMIDWSETSQIVALLTREHGVLRGLAKGSKRMSPSAISRFSGGIDLLTGGQVVGTIKATADLASITEWDLQQPFHHLHTDLCSQWMAMYAADLCGALVAEHEPHRASFAAMMRLLETISRVPADGDAALLRFAWDLLNDAGLRPNLDTDVRSAEPLPKRATYTFDPHRGGFAVDKNEPNDDQWRVRSETLQLLRALAETADQVDAGATTLKRANRLLCVYVRAILDRELPTMNIVLDRRT